MVIMNALEWSMLHIMKYIMKGSERSYSQQEKEAMSSYHG